MVLGVTQPMLRRGGSTVESQNAHMRLISLIVHRYRMGSGSLEECDDLSENWKLNVKCFEKQHSETLQ